MVFLACRLLDLEKRLRLEFDTDGNTLGAAERNLARPLSFLDGYASNSSNVQQWPVRPAASAGVYFMVPGRQQKL